MKNHIRVDGKLLQTNKAWGDLKRKQQEWIYRIARDQYAAFIKNRGKLPVEGSKKQLIEELYAIIQDREIWIPYRVEQCPQRHEVCAGHTHRADRHHEVHL